MKSFINVVKEINSTLNSIVLFDNILNSFIIFLSVYLALSIFNFYPLLASLPAIAYLALSSYKEVISSKAKLIETKYGYLNEKLRTAADNASMENPVVDALHEEVIEEIKDVRASSFFNQKKTSLKILSLIVLCFLIVFLSTLNLSFLDFRVLMDNIQIIGNGGVAAGEGGETPSAGEAGNQDIYGEESIASLGKEEVKIEIKPVNYEVNAKSIGDAPEEKEFEETFPEEVFASSTEGFEENIPISQQELVKEYFKKLAGG